MNFIGENVRQLRELNGLSRKELADKLNVTEQAIWQYENNKTLPSMNVFNMLSKRFNVSYRYFFIRNHIDNNVTSEEHIAYRADDRDSRKKTKFELQYLNFIEYYINYFESFLKVPDGIILNLQKDADQIIDTTINRSEKIQKIARLTRDELQLTDNRRLMVILERSGIYVLEKKNLGNTIDAYSTITDNGRLFIILGTYRKSAVRRTFDLAHELGHILLHRNVDMEMLEKKEYKSVEKEANDFASELLMPKDTFVNDFQQIVRPSNPLSYLELKKKYYVSIAALELRAYKLGLLNYQQNRYFYARMHKFGYKKEEPLDNEWAPIKPGKIKAMMDAVFKNKLLDISDISNTMYISKTFLIDLFDLDNSYFDNFVNRRKQYYSVNKNVINLF